MLFFAEPMDTLDSFPDSDGKVNHLPHELKKQFILNAESEVYDSAGIRIHPYRYPEVFTKDVWCIMDVSMR